MKNETETLTLDQLDAVSGGVARMAGGQSKSRFPSECPVCGKQLLVTKLDTGDTVTCIYCEAVVHALNR